MVERRPLVLDGGTVKELADGDSLQRALPLRTMILPHTNGGLGGTVATSLAAGTAGSTRFVVKLPVDVNRWRIKIRNRDSSETAKTSATLKKLVVGQHSLPGTGDASDTGSFAGSAATTIVSTDQTIPGDGSYYVSPWVTTAGALFTANQEWLLAFGWTFASSTAVQTGAGKAWTWTNATSGTDPTVAGSGGTVTFVPFEWVIEYECTTRRQVCFVIGDSIFEPIGGGRGTSSASIAPTPLWRGNVYLWAAEHNRLVVNISLAGWKLSDYATDMSNVIIAHIWNRLSLGTYPIDELLISGGSNDAFGGGGTLATMQAAVLTLISRVQTLASFTGPVYMGTIIPRTTTGDTVRAAYNDWLSLKPSFCTAVIDFAGAMRGASSTALWPDYTCDTIHPSWLGHRRMATELATMLP
ncbi:SGNH/GDSL hydrolase family protein [Nocardia cerradoensis]|uniref:SGNH hydrolase-type esterase domain-containing protein n=1 Tax=Nocardia cerradoensis TaxID=85688 RepID=A0A231GTI7_9NOCA|nr:SGNH/GDSL hydrolase family protein [Nocardia cerradoensis]NKY48035.1 SGNH/GDSL hydrolase family protein [Nocardia cerradoensis]OXR39888.1 hypothetical protein B7C42_08034 [Nocardia cerradoensis]